MPNATLDVHALARQLDDLLGLPPGTMTEDDVKQYLGIVQKPVPRAPATEPPQPASPAPAAPQGGPAEPEARAPEVIRPIPIETDEVVRIRLKHSGQVVEFPASMRPSEIKSYLDRTFGPNRPKSARPFLEDLAGAVTDPLKRIRESVSGPSVTVPKGAMIYVPGGGFIREEPTKLSDLVTGKKPATEQVRPLADPLALIELSGSVPWGMAQRATEQLWERGAAAATGRPAESTWPSTIAGLVGGIFGPWAGARALRALGGRGTAPTAVTPPRPAAPTPRRPIAALPPAGGTTPGTVGRPRVFQMAEDPRRVFEEDIALGIRELLPPERGLAETSRPGATGLRTQLVPPEHPSAQRLMGKAVPEGGPTPQPRAARPRGRVDLETRRPQMPPGPAEQPLGRPWLSQRPGALGALGNLTGKFLSPVWSRMERLGAEGFEASRLLRRALLDTAQRTARDVQPLVDEIKQLNRVQKQKLFEHLHRGRAIDDPVVASAAQAFQRVYGPEGILPAQMRTAGLQLFRREGGRRVAVGPFQARERFFPLEYPGEFKSRLAESRQFRETKARELVELGQARDMTEARRIVREFIEGRRLGRQRLSPGEYVREAQMPGFIEDPAEAALLRGWRTSRRLAEIEHLGPNDENLKALVQQLRTRSPEAGDELETLIDIALGGRRGFNEVLDKRIGRIARTARSAQAFFKLPLAMIPNMSQSVWTAFRTDAASTLGALAKHMFRRRESVRTAKELGAYTDIAARQLMQEYASSRGERLLGKALYLFNTVERFNRIIAANAGKAWAARLEAAIQRHEAQQASRLHRELRRLGFADDEARAALAARRFTPEQHNRIALEIVDQTQFIPSKGGRSEFFNSELGSTLGQFKTFSMNLARMLNRTVLDELRAGNPRPAIRLLFYVGVPLPLAGELVADTRAIITGRARPSLESEFTLRVIENLTSVGALGIATDALISMTSGRTLVDFMAGPTMDDLARLVTRIVGLAGSETPEEAARQGVELGRFALRRAVPLLGPSLTTHIIPPTVPAPGYPRSPELTDVLGLSPRSGYAARTRERERKQDQRRRWLRYKQQLSR